MDYELTLFDRLEVIKTTNQKYDLEHNAYLSFSGGKDSTILHYLLDMALPNNKIPRVFIDTGIEYQKIREFVLNLAKEDDRFVILKPSKPIKQTLDKVGYPFKSKQHSANVELYKRQKEKFEGVKKVIDNDISLLTNYNYIHALPIGIKTLVKYYYGVRERESVRCINSMTCPKCLREQFTPDYKVLISKHCCDEFKKKPVKIYEQKSGKSIAITGMRREEGGNRTFIGGCVLIDKGGNAKKFHPLLVVNDEWEEWIIREKHIKLCELYYPPYNFKRTGCAGCPYNIHLMEDLETMERLLPNQRKQCEIVWKPIYDEYRRLNYRLKSVEQIKLF